MGIENTELRQAVDDLIKNNVPVEEIARIAIDHDIRLDHANVFEKAGVIKVDQTVDIQQ